jgi:hypothetical protein
MKTFKEHRFENLNKLIHKYFFLWMDHGFYAHDIDLIVFGQHPNNSMSPKDYLSDREKDIVLSTIQWLGSPVGQRFLDRCGFEPKKN